MQAHTSDRLFIAEKIVSKGLTPEVVSAYRKQGILEAVERKNHAKELEIYIAVESIGLLERLANIPEDVQRKAHRILENADKTSSTLDHLVFGGPKDDKIIRQNHMNCKVSYVSPFEKKETRCSAIAFLEALKMDGNRITRSRFEELFETLWEKLSIFPKPDEEGHRCYSLDDIRAIKGLFGPSLTVDETFSGLNPNTHGKPCRDYHK